MVLTNLDLIFSLVFEVNCLVTKSHIVVGLVCEKTRAEYFIYNLASHLIFYF